MDLAELYKTQISFTEWFAGISHQRTAEMRAEDNTKRDRLRVLYGLIGLPFDEPYEFPATELLLPSARFAQFLVEHGNEHCALRLIPQDPSLPKFRLRGKTIHGVMEWFHEQRIDPIRYKADFVPHADTPIWSTIFIVNANGIFGEIIAGGHHQLTQGIYDGLPPTTFHYDFQHWRLNGPDPAAEEHLREIIRHIHVPAAEIRAEIQRQFNAPFAQEYLCGYFETTTSKEFGLWFIDWNRILGAMYHTFTFPQPLLIDKPLLLGQVGCSGIARGTVRIVELQAIRRTALQDGEILVCTMTTPAHLPLMKSAAAIITDLGGILTHAAIVSRELGKPCIVGCKVATKVLQNGDLIEVDANTGIVRKL